MKKLMIAAAAMCVGLAAQAMTSWSLNISDFQNHSETGYCSGDVSLYAYEFDGAERDAKVVYTSYLNGDQEFREEFTTEELASWTDYTFYFTAVDEDGWTYKSDVQYGTDYGMPLPTTIAWNYPTGGTWTAPEPTSGLLMLLGVAGLALKRRRA